MNRAQRRAAKKQQPKWQRMTHDQKLAALVKNGITQKDLDSAYEDRLPKDDATYLVYGRNGYGIVSAVYYGDGEWLTCDDLTNITRFVTHWMPLPDIEGIDDET